MPQVPRWEAKRETVFLASLPNFALPGKSITLADATVIRELTDSERRRISISRQQGFFTVFGLNIVPDRFAIAVRETTQSYDEAEQNATSKFERVIRALRLLGTDSPVLEPSIAYQPRVANSTQLLWPSTLPRGRLSSTTSTYNLDKGRFAELRRLYQGLSRVEGCYTKVKNALRRFDMGGFGRELPEDRLIDFWVALEALFAKDDETQELTYKFAIRIAHFIGNDRDDRKRLFDQLRKAYGVRSRIVHGSQPEDMRVEEAVQVTEDALRRSLYQIAIESKSPTSDELDTIIARGQ